MDLTKRKCAPCASGTPKLAPARVEELRRDAPGWRIEDEKLRRTFEFKNFLAAMTFVNRVADLAEAEGHHPDFCVHYNRVDFTIWTHSVGGLSENDFILAAKIAAV
jgi:4a-hydroxytetrahydrobiopterin dehydratase